MKKLAMAAALAGAALLAVSGPADAQRAQRGWYGHGGWNGHGWRGHGWRGHYGGWGWGWGAGAGFAAGALVGSALAAPYYYGPGYYAYAPRPGGSAVAAPYYYGPGYYAYAPRPGGSAVAYCMRRFKSYDPQSGTYLGYDGDRHPCP